jgi:RimJ/RimL family protein N-acetyltransferase
MFPRPHVRVRPFRPGDEAAVTTVFEGMSPASRRARYLVALDELPPRFLTALRDVDGDDHAVMVAEVGRGRSRRPVGIGRRVVDGPGRAELAYEVVDAWHGQGVGTRLVGALVADARRRGIEELHATLLPDNAASLAILRRHLPTMRTELRAGLVEVRAALGGGALSEDDLLADLAA